MSLESIIDTVHSLFVSGWAERTPVIFQNSGNENSFSELTHLEFSVVIKSVEKIDFNGTDSVYGQINFAVRIPENSGTEELTQRIGDILGVFPPGSLQSNIQFLNAEFETLSEFSINFETED